MFVYMYPKDATKKQTTNLLVLKMNACDLRYVYRTIRDATALSVEWPFLKKPALANATMLPINWCFVPPIDRNLRFLLRRDQFLINCFKLYWPKSFVKSVHDSMIIKSVLKNKWISFLNAWNSEIKSWFAVEAPKPSCELKNILYTSKLDSRI